MYTQKSSSWLQKLRRRVPNVHVEEVKQHLSDVEPQRITVGDQSTWEIKLVVRGKLTEDSSPIRQLICKWKYKVQ